MENVFQVIKYEGDNSIFVWKHPLEDFNSGTQLIVHESQEAVFFMNGQALDSFQAGRYTLSTENLQTLETISDLKILFSFGIKNYVVRISRFFKDSKNTFG